MTKFEQALATCEQVLEDVELGSVSTSSVLLQCLRIARLTNDNDGITWLQYEYGGYPRDKKGFVQHNAWQTAYSNGRGSYNKDGEAIIFTELASELEAKIIAQKSAINNFSTSGASVSGEWANVAMGSLVRSVSNSTATLLKDIAVNEKRLSILKSQYYDYALKKQIELSFASTAAGVFDHYREKVEKYFSSLSSDTINKLQAIEDKIGSDNPEMYSQALTTCRRLFESVATELFKTHYPDFDGKMYKTKSGKEIDVSGDHYLNKMSAVIEKLQDKAVANTVVGSSIIYTLDWIENLNNLQCKGVHSGITKQDATQCIIHTYICLGDILALQETN